MDLAGVIIALISACVATLSLWTAHQADIRSAKSESIKELLEDKEYVAYAALKLLRDGLPAKAEDRQVILLAIMQAVVFQHSDGHGHCCIASSSSTAKYTVLRWIPHSTRYAKRSKVWIATSSPRTSSSFVAAIGALTL